MNIKVKLVKKIVGRFLILGFLAMAVIITSSAQALMLKDLYQARVLVESDSFDNRAQAFETVTKSILDRLHAEPINYQEVSLDAEKLVENYSYTNEAEGKFLNFSLNKKAVESWFAANGLHSLGLDRPLVILWVYLETPDRGHGIVGSDSFSLVKTRFESHAQRYGLAVMLPLLDLTDTSAVDAIDVQNFNYAAVKFASEQRYKPKNIIMGTIKYATEAETDLWLSSWSIVDTDLHWDFNGDTLDDVVENALITFVQYLKQSESSTTPLQPDVIDTRMRVHIDGIDDLDKYAKLLSYLDQIKDLGKFEIWSIEDNTAIFLLDTTRSSQTLKKALTADNFLKVSSISDINQDELRFNLN